MENVVPAPESNSGGTGLCQRKGFLIEKPPQIVQPDNSRDCSEKWIGRSVQEKPEAE